MKRPNIRQHINETITDIDENYTCQHVIDWNIMQKYFGKTNIFNQLMHEFINKYVNSTKMFIWKISLISLL